MKLRASGDPGPSHQMLRRTSWILGWFLILQLGSVCLARQNKLMQVPVMSLFAMSETSTVPRIIHQTWKSSEVPKKYQAWQQSWIDKHPDWQYNLWTDEMNQQLVENHFRWFLPVYNNLPLEIFRADAIRYMYMYKFGGVYADLDFRALKPMDGLLVGSEPVALVGSLSSDIAWFNNFPNAWLASSPGHPFWMFCLMDIARASAVLKCTGKDCTKNFLVEGTTGPIMLWRAIEMYTTYGRKGKEPELRLLHYKDVYPLNWRPNYFDQRCEPERIKTEEDCYKLFPEAYAITYWSHGWA